MWVDYVIRKIMSLRGENLKDYFNELKLEFVVPKLIQYIKSRVECGNVIWLMAEEFNQLNSNEGGLERIASIQIPHRHLVVQALHGVSEEALMAHVLKFSKLSRMPQSYQVAGSATVLVPVLNTNSLLPMAYILLTDVELSAVNKTMALLSKDISYMSKHIEFSIQHWMAEGIAFVDDLTGLFNQRYMSLVLDSEISRSQREQKKFSVLFMDVDYFKSVNDTRGHWVGSRLLIEVGRIIKEKIRKSDFAFRYGGDEFVIVLPKTSSETAVSAAERIRSEIEKTEFIIDGERIKLTLSIGLATYPDHAKTCKDIIKMADEAMYCGKNKSRNIVYVAS